MKNYYKILGIQPDSELIAIKKAFRKLILKYYHDINCAHDTAKMFIEINEAYQVLSDPYKRKKYDEYFKFLKTNISTQVISEVEIFIQKNSQQGSEKAREYSQMIYQDYRRFLIHEIGLRVSYIPHIIAIVFVGVFALVFIAVSLEQIYSKLFFRSIYFFLLSIASFAILYRLIKNIKSEYQFDRQQPKSKY